MSVARPIRLWPTWTVPLGCGLVWLALVGVFEWLRPAGSDVTLCLFRNATGLPCPTCGTTRAVLAAADGRVLDAALFNPFVVIAAIVGGVWLVVTFGCRGLAQFGRCATAQTRRMNSAGRTGASAGRRPYGALKIVLGAVAALLFVANWGYLIAREVGGS